MLLSLNALLLGKMFHSYIGEPKITQKKFPHNPHKFSNHVLASKHKIIFQSLLNWS